MATKKVSDGNGGFVLVEEGQAVILTHLGYMKEDITDIKSSVSSLGDEIKEIKEEMILVKRDTEGNTRLRQWMSKSIVGSLVGALFTLLAWMCGLFSKGAGS